MFSSVNSASLGAPFLRNGNDWFDDSVGNTTLKNASTTDTATPTFFFGVKAGAHEYERRAKWRESDCAAYYKSHGIPWKFMVGRPMEKGHDLSSHNQGGVDTEWEQKIARELLEEQKNHSDMVILPMRDQYMALPDKLVNTLQYAWWHDPKTPYIGEHDIEYCVDIPKANQCVETFEASQRCPEVHGDDEPCPQDKFHYLYAGTYMFKGTEYKSMRGAEGKGRPYFSGHAWFVSRNLVGIIIEENRAHTMLNGAYGSVSEDVDMGKWVAHANETHGARTSFVMKFGMTVEVEKVTLGNTSSYV